MRKGNLEFVDNVLIRLERERIDAGLEVVIAGSKENTEFIRVEERFYERQPFDKVV